MRPGNNRKKGIQKNRRRIRTYRRYYNNYTYATSSKPTRYGPGTNNAIINNFHDLNSQSLTRISINNEILNSNEYNAKAILFKYFKIRKIKVVFYPINSSGGTILVNLSWNQISSETSYLEKDDSTKIVTAYRTRTKVFTWLPPRMILNVNSTSQTVPVNFIDISRYIEVDRVVDLPGWIFIQNNNASSYKINVEVHISFRGNDFYNTTSKIEKLYNKLKYEENKIKDDKIELLIQEKPNITKEEIKNEDIKIENKIKKKKKKNKHKEKHKLEKEEKENLSKSLSKSSVDWLTDPEDSTD